jgi:predicted enzyme involved in methoxymalonyl-ACP biosynthesis
MKSFAQPQFLVDYVVVVGPTEDRGTILAICSGNEEPEVCSRFGIDTQSVVRLEAS